MDINTFTFTFFPHVQEEYTPMKFSLGGFFWLNATAAVIHSVAIRLCICAGDRATEGGNTQQKINPRDLFFPRRVGLVCVKVCWCWREDSKLCTYW